MQREIAGFRQVAGAYKHLRRAFENESLVATLQGEREQEDKRIKMLQRDPQLAQKLFPFKARMGVAGLGRREPRGEEEGGAHVPIDEEFLKRPMDPTDERVQRSLRYL